MVWCGVVWVSVGEWVSTIFEYAEKMISWSQVSACVMWRDVRKDVKQVAASSLCAKKGLPERKSGGKEIESDLGSSSLERK